MGVVSTVFSIFLLLFIGYAMKKIRVLKAEDANLLNTVALYITLPAFIFQAIHDYRQPLKWELMKVPLVGFAMMAIVLVLAYLLARAMKLDRPTTGGMMLAAAFGNTGFLGYPVTQAAFGTSGALVTTVLYDMFAMALPLYLIGTFIAANFGGDKAEPKAIIRMALIPPLLTVPIALILRPFTMPHIINHSLEYLAGGTIPLVMISLGLSLSASSLRGYARPAVAALALKLAVLPCLTFFAYRAAGLTGTSLQVGTMESGMPTAVMACVVASKFGANGRFVAGVIFVSTLVSLATIPTALLILRAY